MFHDTDLGKDFWDMTNAKSNKITITIRRVIKLIVEEGRERRKRLRSYNPFKGTPP
jgi:hypothetical protein